MAQVFIPTLLQSFTGGLSQISVEGATVGQVVENLDKLHPGISFKLLESNRLRHNISVAVDGEISPLGLLEHVGPASEVHFVTAIKGG
jgi:hypothetical protein